MNRSFPLVLPAVVLAATGCDHPSASSSAPFQAEAGNIILAAPVDSAPPATFRASAAPAPSAAIDPECNFTGTAGACPGLLAFQLACTKAKQRFPPEAAARVVACFGKANGSAALCQPNALDPTSLYNTCAAEALATVTPDSAFKTQCDQAAAACKDHKRTVSSADCTRALTALPEAYRAWASSCFGASCTVGCSFGQ